MSIPAPPVPYFSQWESADRAAQIVAGELHPADDPSWSESGATSAAEYAEWANHICGMACLKMLLAARTGTVYPTMTLTEIAVEYGAYVVKEGAIHGMIYAPLVKMLKLRFGIGAEVITGITAPELASLMPIGSLFFASVHDSIRWLKVPSPKKGGHLVLVTQAESHELVFHNPSGHTAETQRDVKVPVHLFQEFFAGRGVLVPPPNAT